MTEMWMDDRTREELMDEMDRHLRALLGPSDAEAFLREFKRHQAKVTAIRERHSKRKVS
jgi:hypothetical protein